MHAQAPRTTTGTELDAYAKIENNMGVKALLSGKIEPIMLDGLGNSQPRPLNSLGKLSTTPSTVDSGGRGSSCSSTDTEDLLLGNARDRLSMVQQLLRDVELSSSSASRSSYSSYSSSKKCHAAAAAATKQSLYDAPITSRRAIIRRRHSLCISRFVSTLVSTEPIKISTKKGTHTKTEQTSKLPTEEELAFNKTSSAKKEARFNRRHTSLAIRAKEEKKDLRNLFESCFQGQDQTAIVPVLHKRSKSSNDLSTLPHAANNTKSLSSKIQSLREQIVLSQASNPVSKINTMRFQQNQRKVGVCSKTRLPHERPLSPPKLGMSYKPCSTRRRRDKNVNVELQSVDVPKSRLNFLLSCETQEHIPDLVESRMDMQDNRVPSDLSDNTTAEHCRNTSFDCDTDNRAHDSDLLIQIQVPKNKSAAPSGRSSLDALLPDPPASSDRPRQENGNTGSQASNRRNKKSPSQQPQEELDKSALSLFSDPLCLGEHNKKKGENETVMATTQRMYPKDKKKQYKKKLDPKGTTSSSSRYLRKIKSEGSSGTSKNYKLRQQQLQQLYPRSLSTPGNVSSYTPISTHRATVGRYTKKPPHFQNHSYDSSHKIQRMEQLKHNIDMQRNLKKEKHQKTKDVHIFASGGRTIKGNNVSAKTGRDSCFA